MSVQSLLLITKLLEYKKPHPYRFVEISFASEAAPNLLITSITLSMLSDVTFNISKTSSANIMFVMVDLSRRRRHFYIAM